MKRNKMNFQCGCEVDGYNLNYCPKHAAAEDMYEVLKLIQTWMLAYLHPEFEFKDMFTNLQKALAKAEGK